MIGPSSVIPDTAPLQPYSSLQSASFSLLSVLGRSSYNSLPRNDFQLCNGSALPGRTGPDMVLRACFNSMPSRPIMQACRDTNAPSSAVCAEYCPSKVELIAVERWNATQDCGARCERLRPSVRLPVRRSPATCGLTGGYSDGIALMPLPRPGEILNSIINLSKLARPAAHRASSPRRSRWPSI
jgi:hypothetical protein